MRYYRLYFMDRFSGHIDHFREFEADDDSTAVDIAEGWADGSPMELWNRDRKLQRWEEPVDRPD
jgi:hypothetical protein